MKNNNNKFQLTIIAMILGAMSSGAFAVSAVPQAATGENLVYIEQIGSSNTVEIEQVGGTNKVGGTDSATPSATNYATINGSSNQVYVKQTGDNNTNQYVVLGDSNRYTSIVTGYDNVMKFNIGGANAAVNLRNVTTDTVTGDTNNITQTIVGNDNASTTTFSGNRNTFTRSILTSHSTSNVSVSGNDNQITSQMIDTAGANGHSLAMSVTGDYNTYAIQQQGTNDTTVNINTVGGHNTVSVRTSSSTIVGAVTATAR